MRKRFDTYFPWFFSVGDFLIFLFSVQTTNFILQISGVIERIQFPTLLILSGIWMTVCVIRNDYKVHRAGNYNLTIRRLAVTLGWFYVGAAVLWPILQGGILSWTALVCSGFVLAVFMGIFRLLIHLFLRKQCVKAYNCLNAVTVGRGGISPDVADIIALKTDFGINLLGHFDDQSIDPKNRGIIDFFEVAPRLDLDIIYVEEQLELKTVKRIIDFADEHYLQVKLLPRSDSPPKRNLFFPRGDVFYAVNVNDTPLDNAFNSLIKRTFDLVFASLVTLLILSWLIPLVGVLIKLESGGTVFFVQKRNGINNEVFNCLKFRSMMPNEYADTRQATKNDSRMTAVGAFLRKTSLDEMPQFLNVLMGDMSIIGPRPHTIPMNRTFKSQMVRYNSRHKIRPGITGLAQVSGFRGEIENAFQIRSRVRLDYFYIRNWSFILDMSIIAKTVRELIFNRENVY